MNNCKILKIGKAEIVFSKQNRKPLTVQTIRPTSIGSFIDGVTLSKTETIDLITFLTSTL